MRVCFLFFLVGTIVFMSCRSGQEKVIRRYHSDKVDAVITYPDKNDTLSCRIDNYYPSGTIFKSAVMLNGKYVGKKMTFYESGRISQIDSLLQPCDTTSPTCKAVITNFHPNGNIYEQYQTDDRGIDGFVRVYNNNGKLLKEYNAIRDSIKDGVYKEFYENGNVAYKATYKDNVRVDYTYFFSENGDTLKYYYNYKGIMDFPYRKFLENGNSLLGAYTDTTRNAVTWVWYEKGGKEIKRKTLKPTKTGFITPDH